jgi:hypothetical protein
MELKSRESCSLFVDGEQHTRQRAIAEGRERRGPATLDSRLINRVAARTALHSRPLPRLLSGLQLHRARHPTPATRRRSRDDTMLVVWRSVELQPALRVSTWIFGTPSGGR